jgi:hypothetical protein
MRNRLLLLGLALPALAGPLLLARPSGSGAQEKTAAKAPSATEALFFEKEILPILKASCIKCHGGPGQGGPKLRSGLSLRSRAGLLKGGDRGPAVSLTHPETSLLLKAINYQGGLEMPPSGKLPAKQIETLTRWVKMGAPWVGGTAEVAAPAHKGLQVTAEDRNYWAYRPIKRPAVPAVKDRAWVRNPIDAFLLAGVEAKGLSPAPPADRTALIRRVYYDLTGLPPSPEEIDAFARDESADAYERLVDRLLKSPHYGEKWARHWLDIVRYAETNGFERDSAKPFAWRYRDYVIDAFNNDKPFDLFVREQLAGDLLDRVTPESLIATGYYRLGQWDDEPADRLLARYDVLDGVVSTTAQAFLGMSVGCARCHDHKKDPIPQKDYYRLLAFFHNITDMNGKNTRRIQSAEERLAQEKLLRERQAREAEWASQIYQRGQRFAVALAEKKGIRVSELPPSDLVGLTYRFYRDTWDNLPDFDALKHEAAGPIAHNYFTLAPASRAEAIGLLFEGKLRVPQAGAYTFRLESTDGARLLLDGSAVLDRPGKGRQSASATVKLRAGLVPVRLEYFNGYDRPHLKVDWSGPGVPRRPLTEPATASAHGSEPALLPSSRLSGQTWTYTFERQATGWQHPDFDAKDWKTGEGGFGTFGTPGAVVRTVWATPDIYLRRAFQVDGLPQHLALDLHHDDDAQIYLNGTLIHRAKGYTVKYGRVQLGPEALKPLKRGTNVLAVHCRQTTGGQYIDVGLLTGLEAPDLAALIRRHGAEVLGGAAVREYVALVARLEQSRKAKPVETGLEVMCVTQAGAVPTHVLIRGNPGSKGEPVAAGFPEVLEGPQAKSRPIPAAAGRLALADWLTDPRNSLTARVLANRLWQYHFGRGIVPTPNDFGKLGEPPTHPELLDWLASELVSGGWKLKRMHKLILLSSAYRMSSKGNDKALRVDPANALFWRFNMRRLTAEEVRDSMLAVSGRLNLKMGGPSIYPPIAKEVLAGQSVPGAGWKTSPPEEAARRSVYVHVKRSLQVPILAQFDQADTDSSCPVRFTTTVPTQALGVLNGEFSNEQAALFAQRLGKEAPGSLEAQVRRAIRLTTGRVPSAEEVRGEVAFVRQLQERNRLAEPEALRFYCLMMLNANEFIYLD